MKKKCFFIGICFISCFVFAGNDTAIRLRRIEKQLLKQQNEIQSQSIEIKRLKFALKKQTQSKTSKRVLPKPVITTQKTKVKTRIYGHLNQSAVAVNDGHKNYLFFNSNENLTPRVGLVAEIDNQKGTKAGGQVELGLKANPSSQVSQHNQSPNSSIDIRKAEVFVKNNRFGDLYLGKGSTASDFSTETDLSGSSVLNFSGIANLYGGLIFRSSETNNLTGNPTIAQSFNNLDGLSRKTRLRYDTPSLSGFSLSTSAVENSQNDVTLRFKRVFKSFKLAASLAYTSPTTLNDVRDNLLDGSASILLNNGLSGTIAGAKMKSHQMARNSPNYYYGKLGYDRKYMACGKTNVSMDYGRFSHYLQNNDVGKTVGFGVVQDIDAYNLAVYVGARRFLFHRTNARFKKIDALVSGLLFKF